MKERGTREMQTKLKEEERKKAMKSDLKIRR
jgi:hypothetical protein